MRYGLALFRCVTERRNIILTPQRAKYGFVISVIERFKGKCSIALTAL